MLKAVTCATVSTFGVFALGSCLLLWLTKNLVFINVHAYLLSADPWLWASLGVYGSVGFSVLGGAWGMFTAGAPLLGVGEKKPQTIFKNVVSIIFCEVVAVYGLIIAIVLSSKIEKPTVMAYTTKQYGAGYRIFWAGLTNGITNLACGVALGITGSSTTISVAHDPGLFVRTLIISIFASIIGLFGLIISIVFISQTTLQ